MKMVVRMGAAAGALALLGGGLVATTAAAEEAPAPKTRVTFMCKMPVDGYFTMGTDADAPLFSAGDYVFRIREEAGVPVSYTAGVGGAGLFTGDLGANDVDYVATATAVAGVSVKTIPGPNTYTGTASTNESLCVEGGHFVPVPAVPQVKEDCFDGGWATFGFRNQGQCVASVVANESAGK